MLSERLEALVDQLEDQLGPADLAMLLGLVADAAAIEEYLELDSSALLAVKVLLTKTYPTTEVRSSQRLVDLVVISHDELLAGLQKTETAVCASLEAQIKYREINEQLDRALEDAQKLRQDIDHWRATVAGWNQRSKEAQL